MWWQVRWWRPSSSCPNHAAMPWPAPADRAARRRARAQAHPGLSPRRLRQDDAARQGPQPACWPAAASRLGLPGGRRQPACSVLDLPRHRPSNGPYPMCRGSGALGAARDPGQPVLGRCRGHPHQRTWPPRRRAGPRPGRLPLGRRARCGRSGLPARPPAAAAAPGHRTREDPHCRWPGCAPGPAGRAARRRPSLHPRRGGATSSTGSSGSTHDERRRRAGVAHRGLDRRATAGRTLAGGSPDAAGSSRFRGRRPLHRGLPGRGGPAPPTGAGPRVPAAAPPFSIG